jgi:cytosine/uracil/thiamine/allantoin permease
MAGSTVVPKLPRRVTALAGAVISILLAVTGLAGNLVNVFLIVGASFGPICGAMTADYLLSANDEPGHAEASTTPATSLGLWGWNHCFLALVGHREELHAAADSLELDYGLCRICDSRQGGSAT